MTWHAPDELIARYVDGRVDLAGAASVEQHLLGCDRCRAALAEHAQQVPALAGVHVQTRLRMRREVERPRASFVERALVRAGLSASSARLAAAAPALRTAGWLAAGLVLLFAVVAAHAGSGARGTLLFVVSAPIVPLAGVSAVYGWRDEPGRELATTTPYSRFRLAMLRTAVVLAVSLVVMGVLATSLPQVSAAAWLWLVPSLALTSVSLGLSSWVDPARTAVAIGGLWLVLAARATSGPRDVPTSELLERFVAFRPAGQLVLAVVAVVGIVVAVGRRTAYEERGPA